LKLASIVATALLDRGIYVMTRRKTVLALALVCAILGIAFTWGPAKANVLAADATQRTASHNTAVNIWGKPHVGTLKIVGQYGNYNDRPLVYVDIRVGRTLIPHKLVPVDPTLVKNGNKVRFWINTDQRFWGTTLDTTPGGVYLASMKAAASDNPVEKATSDTVPDINDDTAVEVGRLWVGTPLNRTYTALILVALMAAFILAAIYQRRDDAQPEANQETRILQKTS